MQPDNKAAYSAMVKATDAYREALSIAAESPIPGDTWHDYGRAMELHERVLKAIRPKGAA